MVAATALRAKAIDEHGPEAGVPINRAGPVAEEVCGLSTPGHAPIIPLICGSGKSLELVAVQMRSTTSVIPKARETPL